MRTAPSKKSLDKSLGPWYLVYAESGLYAGNGPQMMILREADNEMRTDNQILAPSAINGPVAFWGACLALKAFSATC